MAIATTPVTLLDHLDTSDESLPCLIPTPTNKDLGFVQQIDLSY